MARTHSLTPKQRWAHSQALVRVSGSPILQEWSRTRAPSVRRSVQATARAYAGAAFGPTTADWHATGTSADSEIYVSLRPLRNRSRQLIRDNEYAKNAKRVVVNNVIGTGISMQAQVTTRDGQLDTATNDLIEREWNRWSRKAFCHTAGRLGLRAMQRFLVGNVFESGDIGYRFVHKSFGGSKVPLALELIEADQLVDTYSGKADNGNTVRMGVEVDEWQRPVAYFLHTKHPGDYSFSGTQQQTQYRRILASEMQLLGTLDRPYQTRSVPWLHATLTKLRHMGGYEEAEIVAARAAASIMGFREVPELDIDMPSNGDDDEDGAGVEDESPVMNMAPGKILTLPPGEKFNGFSPNRPNAALEPFMRFMLRSVASGVGVSYESLSRDYSQSNYSSSRLALLDDRDGWRILQQWFIDEFMQPVFERWLDMAVLAGVLNLPGYESDPDRYREVEWHPRGWSWVDPAKEQGAAKSAVRSGHSTLTDDLAEQGKSVETVFKRRRRELDLAKQYGLVLDTDPAQVNDKGAEQGAGGKSDGEDDAGASEQGKENELEKQ